MLLNNEVSISENLFTETTCQNIKQYNNVTKNLNGLNILHMNIRSMEANFVEFEILLKKLIKKPKIIILTEMWKVPYKNLYKIDGYNSIFNDSSINKSDGTLVFIDKHINYTTKIVNIGMIKAIEISYNNEIITAIYRNHKINIKNFVDDLKEYLEYSKYKNHYIIGDINIDIFDKNFDKNKYNHDTERYINNFLELGYFPVTNNITRPNKKKPGGTCIDHIFVKTDWSNKSIKSFTCQSSITDHYIISLNIDTNIISDSNNNKKFYTINFRKLKNLANKANWNKVYEFQDVDEATNFFVNIIKTIIENSRVKSKKKYNKRSDWLSKIM